MRYSHSQRTNRRPPRVSEDYDGVGGYSYGYDPADMAALDVLIKAKSTTPRAELRTSVEASAAAVLRRVIDRER